MAGNKEKPIKNIGLFGSSFDPPHVGHAAVIQDLSLRGVFDEIWLLPVYKHAFGKVLVSFENRLEMVRILVQELALPSVVASSVERDLGKSPSFTFDVVESLLAQNPDFTFSIILGSDAQQDLSKWHRIDELRKIAAFYFVPRAGFESSPYPDVSSTQIRNKRKAEESITGMTTAGIENYILKMGLYSV